MIYFFTPYSFEKRLGRAFNQYIQLVPFDNDYICLTDGDVMFLTTDFGQQIRDILLEHDKGDLFTCYTNRIKNKHQQYQGIISENFDLRYHEDIANKLRQNDYKKVSTIETVISGHLLVFSKKLWREVGGFYEEGILKVDNKFSRAVLDLGRKIYLMEGMYVFHKYRTRDIRNKSHLL
jgi:GT2 family glycosyltransferase